MPHSSTPPGRPLEDRSFPSLLPHGLCLLGGLVMALAAAPDPGAAQPLRAALCPAGSVFDLRPPGLVSFAASGGAGIPLLRHTVDPLAHPEARCNDGSPAVFYIRPANAAFAGNPTVTESHKWLIFFDGGGGCRDADSCLLDRWCGGNAFYERAGKMSSLLAPGAIREPGGIFHISTPPIVPNHFADYNQVFVLYCSSDTWIGSAQHLGITTSSGVGYDIGFFGEAIVNAVFDTLLAGPTPADPRPSELYYGTPLPDLDDADEIVIGGESAGGVGVRHHIDRLREDVLEPRIAGVVVKALIDAAASPGMWDPSIDWSDPASPADFRDSLLNESEPVVRTFWGTDDSALDASCLDPTWTIDHDAVGSHPQVCYDATYTLLNHITTPVFLRMDIDDPVAKQRYYDWSLYPLMPDDYRTAQFLQLLDFSAYSPAAGGLEPPLDTPGIQGPNCAEHVAVQRNDGFFRWNVTGPAVVPLPFHDLLANWLTANGGETIQIQRHGPGLGYSPSFCP